MFRGHGDRARACRLLPPGWAVDARRPFRAASKRWPRQARPVRPSSIVTGRLSTAMPSSSATSSCSPSGWVDRGVGPGDVVSIQLPNWYEFVVIALGDPTGGWDHQPVAPHLPAPRAAPRPHGRRVEGAVHPGPLSRPRPSRRVAGGHCRLGALPRCTWWSTRRVPPRWGRSTPPPYGSPITLAPDGSGGAAAAGAARR